MSRARTFLSIFVRLSFLSIALGQIRINAGGGSYQDSRGRTWNSDRSFKNGATYESKHPISGTSDDSLYQSERWQDRKKSKTLKYNIPVTNGKYDVRLLFSENYRQAMKVGARVFDVFMEGKLVMPRVDIFKETKAGFKKLDKVTPRPVTVSGNMLTIEFVGRVGNPKIGAIEVIPVQVSQAAAAIHSDIRQVVKVVGDNPQGAPWADSYSVGDRCYCESTFDHNIGKFFVKTPRGWMTVKQVCDLLGPGPGSKGRPIYNDIQCGNGPPNDAGDEHTCPGRVDMKAAGCGHIGPKWNFEGLTETTQSVVIDVGGPGDKTEFVRDSGSKTWTYMAKSNVQIDKNGSLAKSIFRSHRSGAEVVYDIGGFVPDKLYRVTFGFAETWQETCKAGARVMTIKVNGSLYSNDLDVYKEGGCGGVVMKKYVLAANGSGRFNINIGAKRQYAMLSYLSIEPV